MVSDLFEELGLHLPDYFGHRDLPDGRHICVVPLTFGRARLIISQDTHHTGYEHGY